MSAPTTTKIQVNLKTPNGALLNVYAATTEELDYGLNLLAAKAQDILDIEALFRGVGNVVNVGLTAPAGTAQAMVTSTQAPPLVPATTRAASSGHTCAHGERKFIPKKDGWNDRIKVGGYFCPLPKGDSAQCKPEFV